LVLFLTPLPRNLQNGGAQTAATCSELLQAMQRMPTLDAVEPKTSDGSDFLRALKKHRELQDRKEQQAEAACKQVEGGETEEGEPADGVEEEEEGGLYLQLETQEEGTATHQGHST